MLLKELFQYHMLIFHYELRLYEHLRGSAVNFSRFNLVGIVQKLRLKTIIQYILFRRSLSDR